MGGINFKTSRYSEINSRMNNGSPSRDEPVRERTTVRGQKQLRGIQGTQISLLGTRDQGEK
jgi:hypothetical protein